MCKLQPRSRSVKVRDINMRYADWGGEGPLLLLLHGAMRTSRSWDAVARALRDEYHVISLDARGHGDSDWTGRGYRFSHRVEDMRAFCRELGIQDATAVGHSNGAVVFAMLADQHPEFFRGLVLLEPMLVVGETPGELPPPRRTSRRRRTWSDPGQTHSKNRHAGNPEFHRPGASSIRRTLSKSVKSNWSAAKLPACFSLKIRMRLPCGQTAMSCANTSSSTRPPRDGGRT